MVNVPYASYKNMLMREAIVTVFLKCSVPKSDQTFAHMDTIRLMKPCLRVQVILVLSWLLVIISRFG